MSEMKNFYYPNVVIFHKDCTDGMGAAWAAMLNLDHNHANRSFTQLIPMSHNRQYVPEGLEGKRVMMVDFAYSDEKMMLELLEKASEVVLLDHHKTSLNYKDFQHPKLKSTIDMTRSGAQLAWDYFFNGENRPALIDYIGERDLWSFTLPNVHQIVCYIYSQEATIEWLDELYVNWDRDKYAAIGASLLKSRESNVNAICKGFNKATFTDKEGKEYLVMAGDCCWIYRSDVGNKLMETNPDIQFVLLYSYYADTKIFGISVRGKDKVDLSALAKSYGGGGHPNASGMKSSDLDFLKFIPWEPKPASQ